MEWVETTGRTIEEARDAALDMLGVDESDAEFVTLSEPRPGLFGRLRGEARIRARVMPTTPPPKRNRSRRPVQRRGPANQRSDRSDAEDSREPRVAGARSAPVEEGDAEQSEPRVRPRPERVGPVPHAGGGGPPAAAERARRCLPKTLWKAPTGPTERELAQPMTAMPRMTLPHVDRNAAADPAVRRARNRGQRRPP